MRDLDDIQPEPGQGFQFPGQFEITAMGKSDAEIERRVVEIIESLGLAVEPGSLRVRPSREGNYRSVTVTFACPTREKHDEVHGALRAHPAIKWTI